jgi:glycosyltransferase involved in cell wall biosynthesis
MWELMTAVMSMRPEIIINVNSETMWNCYERFAPELSRNMRLGAIAFCHVGDKGDRPIGYTATHLERVLPFLDLVVTDNQSIINQLRHVYASVPVETRVATETEFAAAKLLAGGMDTTDARHHLAASLGHRLGDADWAVAKRLARHMTNTQLDDHDVAKFSCLYQYTDPPRPRPATRPRSERPQILWASRVTRTKFPELLPRIARLLPDCDIHAYGAREIGYRFPAVKNLLFPYHDLGDRLAKAPNLFWHGPYKRFAELPLERFDAMLYTGLYDGLPNVLLEAGANRLPIIAPVRVGGIGELIDERTGWPVTDPYDARAFAESFRELVHRPEEARIRADALADLIARRHSLDSFRDAVRDLVENPTSAVRATPVTLTTADALEMEGQPHDPALVPSGGSLMSEVQILESQQVP